MPSSTLPSTGSTTHTSKRHITEYFSSSTSAAGATASTGKPSGPPPLPDNIRSELMHVGMRIRMAMAAGYKTPNTTFPSGSWTNGIMNPAAGEGVELDLADPFASIPASQESIPGIGIAGSNELKRAHSCTDRDEKEEEEGTLEQKDTGVQRSAFDTLMANRHLAIPKSKRRDASKRGHHASVLRREVIVGAVEDFGDASFLRPVDQMDMDDV